MKTFFKNNIKFILGTIIGLVLSGVGVYALTVTAVQVSYDNSQSGIEFTTVQGAIDELYTKASSGGGYSPEGCVAPTLNVGDYVSLTPDSTSYTITSSLTGYTSDQTINPSELTLWRVIKKNPCNVEVVSEYVSSTNIYFKGTTGYANFVGGLNEIARQYGNKYVSSARHMGYDGQTEYISDTSAFDGTTNTAPSETTTPSPTTGTGEEYSGGVAGDTLYLKDYTLVSNVYKSDTTTYGSSGLKAYKAGTTTATTYWLASRLFLYGSATDFYFRGRYVYSGSLNSNHLRGIISSWYDSSLSYAVRPILTLKSGITTSGGSGTKASPYTLS